MSEPLTSHEIEDVLSSIRRLVSEDLRPAARAAAVAVPAETARQAEVEAGKLLLTPALRVVPEPAPAVAVDAVVEDVVAEDVVAEEALAEAAPVAAPTAAYDDEGWNQAADPADAGLKQVLDAAAPAEPAPEVWEDGTELIWSSVGAPDEPAEDEADTIVPVPPAAESHGHWSAQDVPGVDWAQEETDWVEPEPVPFVAHPRKAALADDPLARAWADRAEAEVRARLDEAPKATIPPRPQPQPQPQPQPEPAAHAQPDPGLFDGDETEIDEEVLREIVRDIIREELAGTLGERITRNVRKLVRVEVNRALTAREFE